MTICPTICNEIISLFSIGRWNACQCDKLLGDIVEDSTPLRTND